MKKEKLLEMVETLEGSSAWSRGVNAYAFDLVESLQVDEVDEACLEVELLNGADHWYEYSQIGNTLIYDRDIAERLCNPTELKITRNGQRDPNSMETWLDLQARALKQAYVVILNCLK